MTPHQPLRVLIVAECAAMRCGLRHLLTSQADLAVVGAVAGMDDAPPCSPDVVLCHAPWERTQDAQLRQHAPAARIIALASYAAMQSSHSQQIDGYADEQDAEGILEAIYAV